MIRRAESLMRARKVSRLRCPERIASRRHRDIDVSRSFSNLSRGPQLMQPRRGCNAMTISFIVYMTERTCRETSKRTVGRASIPYRPRRLFCAAWRICGRREMVAQALRRRPADDTAAREGWPRRRATSHGAGRVLEGGHRDGAAKRGPCRSYRRRTQGHRQPVQAPAAQWRHLAQIAFRGAGHALWIS